MKAFIAIVTLALTVAMNASFAQAASPGLSLSATTLHFEPGRLSGTIRISSGRDWTDTAQVEVFAWNGSTPGEGLSDTSDLLGVPEIFSIQPGGSQVVRVGLRGPVAGEDEKAYRVVIKELPSKDEPPGMNVLMELNLPVFIAPIGGDKPDFEWSFAQQGSSAAITLANKGNCHLRIESFLIRNGNGVVLGRFNTKDVDRTVMPGASYVWHVTLPHVPSGTLEIVAATDRGQTIATLQ